MTHRRMLPTLATAIALSIAACTGGGSASSPTPTAPAATDAPATDLPAASDAPAPPANGGVPQAVIEAAVADAAARAGVDPAQVTVTETHAADFPNGALGCPEPGMMYAEVITPGYRVVVESGGQSYDYRASARGTGGVRWCERPGPGGLPAAS